MTEFWLADVTGCAMLECRGRSASHRVCEKRRRASRLPGCRPRFSRPGVDRELGASSRVVLGDPSGHAGDGGWLPSGA